MNTYKFSARTNAFYPVAQQAIYEQAGTWPADAVDVDDSVYQEFAANITPVGKMRAVGDDGLPVWIDIPEPDPQLQSTRQTTLQLTLAEVALQCAVDEGKASDAQVAELATIKSEIARRFVTAQLWTDIPEPDPQLRATRKTVSQISLEAFALQCAVDEGKASETQIAELAVLRADIANRIGEKT
ncbi:hypothetical protein EU837_02160 [Salmonella enterica subsp. enterica serovar Kibi]|nr:hypothetical protein [Salmonella enterica subsp. enterica serovar Kibi]ECS0066375.1 tail fiber assembly protein [Salmonella enterica]